MEKMVWVVLFCVTRLDFLKSHYKGPKYTILKSSFARKSQMWWYGRGNIGGSWLPEEKKTNMWHGRGNSSASWPPAFPRSSLTYFLFQFLSLTYSVYFSSLTHILCVGYYLFWSLSCVLVLMLDLFFVMLIVRHHRPNLCLVSCP